MLKAGLKNGSNLDYSIHASLHRSVLRVAGTHLRGLALCQRCSEETLQWCSI